MAKKVKVKPIFFCKHCVHATDFHEKNLNGEYFMCKCKYHKWSRFLNHDYCEYFVKNDKIQTT